MGEEAKSGSVDWPTPGHPPIRHEPIYCFIFAPPYSGSTAIAEVLNSAYRSMVLNPNGEGQWLVPGLVEKTMRWRADLAVDWNSVKAVWSTKVKSVEQLTGRVDVVIEKSPPNMVRAADLLATFPNHRLLVLNRNPYANCASILYRNHDPDSLSDVDRARTLAMLSSGWLRHANLLRNIIESYSPLVVSYERFCEATESTVKEILNVIPQLEGVDPKVKVRVKDYAPQVVSNQNSRQLARLTAIDKSQISQALSNDAELVSYFGYSCDWQKPVIAGGAGQ